MLKKIFGKKNNETYLIVGLGNPEHKYDNTRHNIGFETIDNISKEYSIPLTTKKFKGIYGKGFINGKRVILLKPFTYMNNSGECISKVVSYEKIDISKIVIICDDIHLPVGKLRLKTKGSPGGHNGLKNIELHLHTSEYMRLRIGVGEVPRDKNQIDYVLGKFSKEEVEVVDKSIRRVVATIPELIDMGIEHAMNKLNAKM